MKNLVKQVLREEAPVGGSGSSLVNAFSVPAGSPVPPATPPGSPPPAEFKPGPMWEKAKTVFGVEPPADLTAETEMDRFFDVVKGKVVTQPTPPPNIHPVAAELNQKLTHPNFKMDEWVLQQSRIANMDKLEGKEFLKAYFQFQYPDAAPEKIDSIVSSIEKSGMIELQELQYKKEWTEAKARQEQDYQARTQQEQQRYLQEESVRVQSELQSLFANTQNLSEIYGVRVSKAELDTFNSTFSELVKRDANGQIPIMSLLQSNEDLYKFAFIAINGDQKIKAALTNAKEGTKAAILSKLRTEAAPGMGGTPAPPNVPGQVPNWSNFSKPQQ